MSKKLVSFIVLLTLFSFAIRLFRITEPKEFYFDEVYHVVTAKAIADNNPDAYNPFAKAPIEDTAFDWLHPPLAKLIQAGSIKIFGDEPLGWRLPSVIFGTAIIPATFVLANILFGPMVAIFAATTIAFENLTFVMSRITMNDIFLAFFVVCSFIFAFLYAQKKDFINLLFTAIFLGFAVSTKWSGLYAVMAILAFFSFIEFRDKKKFNFKLILIIIIPFFMYFGSYGQYFLQGYSLNEFIGLHKQIWWYQNREDLTHSYGTTSLFCVPDGLDGPKTWCPWFLNIRGVYFSFEQYGNAKAGYIYALGNPIVFWLGVVSVAYLLGKFTQAKSLKMLLILIGYFIFWVPWIFAPRILFLYHYLPSIPFLTIALGYELRDIYNTRFKYVALFLILIIIATFFYFYPISSGLPIDVDLINRFMWLRTWR